MFWLDAKIVSSFLGSKINVIRSKKNTWVHANLPCKHGIHVWSRDMAPFSLLIEHQIAHRTWSILTLDDWGIVRWPQLLRRCGVAIAMGRGNEWSWFNFSRARKRGATWAGGREGRRREKRWMARARTSLARWEEGWRDVRRDSRDCGSDERDGGSVLQLLTAWINLSTVACWQGVSTCECVNFNGKLHHTPRLLYDSTRFQLRETEQKVCQKGLVQEYIMVFFFCRTILYTPDMHDLFYSLSPL